MDPEIENFPLPVLGVVAYSGTGKTTLLTRLIPVLADTGVRVAVVKHSHHDFEIDKPGKDSHRVREAGARSVLIASPYRAALVTEGDRRTEPELPVLLRMLPAQEIDLVLAEGYRTLEFAKIEVHRPALGVPPLYPEDDNIIAVAADAPLAIPVHRPVLPLDSPDEIALFVRNWMTTQE
ncbi:MAG: molybdopterin-guanine dinucleotide biosynthesis protein B [Pseudomonadota bacterium]